MFDNCQIGDPLGVGSGISWDPPSGAVAAVINRNLLTKTEQFDATAWVKTNATVIANSTADPLGGLTADQIVSVLPSDSVAQTTSIAAATGSRSTTTTPSSTWTRYAVTVAFDTGTKTFSIWLLDPLDSGSNVAVRLQISGGFIQAIVRDGGDGITFFAWGAKLEIGSTPTGDASTYGAVA